MAANPPSFPLYEKVFLKNTTQRVLDVTVLFLLFSLLIYRVLSLQDHGYPWFIALLCESWFTFNWVIIMVTRWTPLEYKTYPEILEQRYHTTSISLSFFLFLSLSFITSSSFATSDTDNSMVSLIYQTRHKI